jgi:hypothetical protein
MLNRGEFAEAMPDAAALNRKTPLPNRRTTKFVVPARQIFAADC